MSVFYDTKDLGNGIVFSQTYDKKFKNNLVTIRFVSKLDENISPKISLLFGILATSNNNIKSRTKLNGLYDSTLKTFAYPFGDYLVAGMSVNFISDKYTIDNEKISDEAVKILLDCIFNPDVENKKFSDKYFKQAKSDLIETIKSEINDRQGYANIRANSFIYKDEPASIYENGTVEVVEKIKNEDLFEVYENLLRKSFIDISVVGDEENSAVNDLIFNALKNINRPDNIKLKFFAPSPLKETPLEITEKCDVNQCKMFMAFKTDNNNLYAQKVMSVIFGGSTFSKLFINVREKMSLCYYCHAVIGNIGECKGTMIVDSGIDKANIEKAKTEIIRQLKSIADGDFSDEMLENSKKALYNGFKSNYDSVIMINSWYYTQRLRGTEYSPDEANEIIKSVTREQIIDAAKSFKLDTVYVLEPEV